MCLDYLKASGGFMLLSFHTSILCSFDSTLMLPVLCCWFAYRLSDFVYFSAIHTQVTLGKAKGAQTKVWYKEGDLSEQRSI